MRIIWDRVTIRFIYRFYSIVVMKILSQSAVSHTSGKGRLSNRLAIISIFFAVLFIGVFARLNAISSEGLGVDELVTVSEMHESTLSGIIDSVRYQEAIPPFYALVLKAWSIFFGVSILSLRLFSALFSVLSLIMIYFVTKEAFGKVRISLIAMLLSSVLITEIVLAQEIRFYSFFGFLVLVSFFLFFKYVNLRKFLGEKNPAFEKSQKKYFIFLILINIFLMYTNYLSLMIFFIQYLIIIFFYQDSSVQSYFDIKKRYLRSAIISLVISIPSMLFNFLQSKYIFPRKPAYFISLGVPEQFSTFVSIIFLSAHILTAIFLIALIFILRNFSFRKSFSRFFNDDGMFFLPDFVVILFGLGICGILIIAKSYLINSFSLVRYTFFGIVLFYLGFSYMLANMKNKSFASIILIIFLITNFFLLTKVYAEPQKIQWQEAAEYIDKNPRTLIIFSKGNYYLEAYNNYFVDDNLDKVNVNEIPYLSWTDNGKYNEISEDSLKSLLNGVTDFWVVAPRMKGKDISHRELIEKWFFQTDYTAFNEVELYKFVKLKNVSAVILS